MDYEILEFTKITDPRGNLSVVENGSIPFDIKRVYYLYDVPSGAERGGHAHKNLKQLLIAISGSFQVILKDGLHTDHIMLNNPAKGLLINPGVWRELVDFSSGAICLVIASEIFDEADYIREYDDFVSYAALKRI